MLQYVILGFLQNRDMTGYEIKQMMLQSTSHFIDASFGSIYPMLKRLAQTESITFEEQVKDGRYQKSYRITEKGKADFLNWLRQPCHFSPYHYEYLAKLFFYQYLTQEERMQQIEGLVVEMKEELEALQQIEQECAGEIDRFEYATLQFGMKNYETMIAWYQALKEGI